jgi:hypothetical protein
VPLGIYVLLNLPSIALWTIGYASLHTAAMFAVLGSGFGGFAFGVGWLLGIWCAASSGKRAASAA